jgi:hypothetical protein
VNQRRLFILIAAVSSLLVTFALAVAQSGSHAPANDPFQQTWARSDKPVSDGVTRRTWMWGPAANTGSLSEPYAEAPDGEREVQYWDKSRMELNDPQRDPDDPWHVTNGLIALELMTGELQLGDDSFETYQPAQIPVAGDPDDSSGPTYATMGTLRDRAARVTGWGISQSIDRSGNINDQDAVLQYGVTDAYFVPETSHNVASVFWEFMNSQGVIFNGEQFVDGSIFPDPFFATGFPVTEAYWAWVKVDNEHQHVLVQCFERRCLTYTPENPDGWQVEASNSGQHYYHWRYELIDTSPPDDDNGSSDDDGDDSGSSDDDDDNGSSGDDGDDNGSSDDDGDNDSSDDDGDDSGSSDDDGDNGSSDDDGDDNGSSDDDDDNGSSDDDDEPLEPETHSLAPLSTIVTGYGVALGAPQAALDETIEVQIDPVDDPTENVPLPENWETGGVELHGESFAISTENDLYTPYGNYLLLGLPIPEGVDPEDVAFAVLSPPGSVIAHGDVEPEMRWHVQRGQYDEENDVVGAIIPFLGSEPMTYTLMTGANFSDVEIPEGLDNDPVPPILDQEFLGFQVECTLNFPDNPCTIDHMEQTENALTEAYDAWVVELGFSEPRLQHRLIDVDLSTDEPPFFEALYMYDYHLDYKSSPNGAYDVKSNIGVTFFPADENDPDPDDLITQHELFHAIQYRYPNTRANHNDWMRGIIEGTATAAEMSLNGLTRSTQDHPTREPRAVDVGILRDLASSDVHVYALQDFWVYLGQTIEPDDPQISYLIPLFSMGSQFGDVEQLISDDGTFESLSEAYWQWVRNQSFEKTEVLGQDGEGNPVPGGDQCVWSGYGTAEEQVVDPSITSVGTGFSLDPLTSRVYEYTLPSGADPYTVRLSVDTSDVPHENVRARFYLEDDAGTAGCTTRVATDSRTFEIDEDGETVHILVSNTDTSATADDIWVEYTILEDVVFQSPDGHDWALFGESIAPVGDNVLIGSPEQETGAGYGAGRAYLFDSVGNVLQTLEAPDGVEMAYFGWSVSAAGDNIVVGAPYHDVGSNINVGRAYLFDQEGNLLQTFQPPTPEPEQEFGYAVAAFGDTILIGATENKFGEDPGDTDGKVHMFNMDGTLKRTIAAPDMGEFAFFGSAIDASDDRILVGARFDAEVPGDGYGRADLFTADGDHLETFYSPEPQENAYFGWDVAITEHGYLVGAPRQNAPSTLVETGRAFLFDEDGNHIGAFDAPVPQSGSRFGSTVAGIGENVMIAAEEYNIDDDLNAGEVYIFDSGGGHQETIQAPEVQTGSWFGRSLATIGEDILVGAHNHNTDAGDFAGEGYLFRR